MRRAGARGTGGRRDLQRRARGVHHRRWPRFPARTEARRHCALPGAWTGRSAGADQTASPGVHPARRKASPAAGGIGARHPNARRTVPRVKPLLVAGQRSYGRRAVHSAAAQRRHRRIDWGVHRATLWPRSGDVPRRTAAGRHSCRRCRPPLGSRAVSAVRGSRTHARQSFARLSQSAIRYPQSQCGRRVQVAARRLERDDRRPRSCASGRLGPNGSDRDRAQGSGLRRRCSGSWVCG